MPGNFKNRSRWELKNRRFRTSAERFLTAWFSAQKLTLWEFKIWFFDSPQDERWRFLIRRIFQPLENCSWRAKPNFQWLEKLTIQQLEFSNAWKLISTMKLAAFVYFWCQSGDASGSVKNLTKNESRTCWKAWRAVLLERTLTGCEPNEHRSHRINKTHPLNKHPDIIGDAQRRIIYLMSS